MKISAILKYLAFSVIFLLIIFALLLTLLSNLFGLSFNNRTDNEICITDVKLGGISHPSYRNMQLNNRESDGDFVISFSEQLSVTYHNGKCTDDKKPINHSCTLDRTGSDSCQIYIYSTGLVCDECYR